MLEELLEVLWGPWGIAAALLVATQAGRKITKRAAREVVKGGLVAGDMLKQVGEIAQESASDIVAEARAELTSGKNGNSHEKKAKGSSKSSN